MSNSPLPAVARCATHPLADTAIYWGMSFIDGVPTEVGLESCTVCLVPVDGGEEVVGDPIRR